MAGKVFFSVTMSLDGFIAPEERMDDARLSLRTLRAVCRSMMCGLPREDARECERLMSVRFTAGAPSLSLPTMAAEVLLDQLLQGQRARKAVLPAEMFERPSQRFRRVTLGGETSPLQPSRTRTVGPVPERPDRAAVNGPLLELENLTQLHRRSLPSHLALV
jgi:hypothetical protein